MQPIDFFTLPKVLHGIPTYAHTLDIYNPFSLFCASPFAASLSACSFTIRVHGIYNNGPAVALGEHRARLPPLRHRLRPRGCEPCRGWRRRWCWALRRHEQDCTHAYATCETRFPPSQPLSQASPLGTLSDNALTCRHPPRRSSKQPRKTNSTEPAKSPCPAMRIASCP